MTLATRILPQGRAAIFLAVFFWIATNAPVPLLAQTPIRIEDELRRTDERLELADSIVREGQSERARILLDQAKRVQASAWENFRGNRPLVAARLTFEARLVAQRAVGFAREDISIRNRALRELEIALTLYDDVKTRVTESGNESARHLLDEARAQIDRGRTQLGEQHYEAALRLALSSQRLIRRAMRLIDDMGGSGRAEMELQRTDSILERARPLVNEANDDEAQLLFDRAVEIQSRAVESFRAGELRAVFPRTREARTLAHRALARVRGPIGAARVQEEIARTDEAMSRAAETLERSAKPEVERMLASARTHQDRARQLLEKQQFRPSLAQTIVARRLALRAATMAGEPH
ncbi:MAG TPA: hypothetical protein VFR10_01265 [bacterium]|nr:hypothetical protein [bacterium]